MGKTMASTHTAAMSPAHRLVEIKGRGVTRVLWLFAVAVASTRIGGEQQLLLRRRGLAAELFEVLLHHLLRRLGQTLHLDGLRSLLHRLLDFLRHLGARGFLECRSVG